MDQWVRAVGLEKQGRFSVCRVVAFAPGPVDTAMQDEIRHSDDSAFPQAERFRALKENGELGTPKEAAMAIWSLLDRRNEDGAVLHIRDLD